MDVRVSQGSVAAQIQLFGCMVSPEFELDGRTVRPLYTAPWEQYLPDPMLSNLRGDFACVPFGIAPESTDGFPPRWRTGSGPAGGHAHGYPANVVWWLTRTEPGSAEFVVDLPDTEPVAQVRRTVTCRPDGLELVDELVVRRDTRLPLGLHPMVRLPEGVGGAVVVPPRCRSIETYPVATDASSILCPDASFDDLGRAPLRAGGTTDLSRLPLAQDTEELVQLCEVETTSLSVENRVEGYRVTVEWDAALRHCLLWISNRGRAFPPWNSRNLCLGVEPVTSAFDLGTAISAGSNPLAARGMQTAVPLAAGRTHRLWHRLAVEPLNQ